MEVKPGEQTTEYEMTKKARVLSYVGLVLGLLLAYGPQIVGWLPEGSSTNIIFGAVVAAAAVLQDALVKLGYIKSRTDIKKANQ